MFKYWFCFLVSISYIWQKNVAHSYYIFIICVYFSVIVPTVSFNQSTYSVNEDDGPAQPVLVLSNPSTTDITVQVSTSDGNATGKIIV